jgi:tRNA (guanosine-2'-O-)-methyltransferase
MRRSNSNSALVAREQKNLIARLAGLDHEAIVKALSPFATDERKARLDAVFGARLDAVTVLMDAPYDPHNGAAVLRSCDAFGIQRLHIIERGGIQFLAARQVARGSEQWVDAHTYATTEAATATLAASKHVLIATHPQGELEPEDLKNIPRLCLVLGNERDGIHPELAAACERRVRIPMRGFAESLNVSVTAAILLQHATASRTGDLSADERLFLRARALILTMMHAPEILEASGIPTDLSVDSPPDAPPAPDTPGSLALADGNR